jgi:hypothetical protein
LEEELVEPQSGYITLDGAERGATLTLEDDRLRLRVTHPDGLFGPLGFNRLDILHFRGSLNVFTLLSLVQISSQMRPGVGGTTTFSVSLAVEGVLFDSAEDVHGIDWLLYVEDLPKILHVSGLQHSLQFDDQGGIRLAWFFQAAEPLALTCPNAGYTFYIGQDFRTTGDPVSGPGMTFRYSARMHTEAPVALHAALAVLNRVRLFFSLLIGRVLHIEQVKLRLQDEDRTYDAKVLGLISTKKSDKPRERLVQFRDHTELALLLDSWLERYPLLDDAIHLHMDGLEQRKLPTQLRFQIFIQALEALHRRVSAETGEPIDVAAVTTALRDQNVPEGVVDRVAGMLAHAHEPGLRQRLRYYWDAFEEELAILRPELSRRAFVDRVVETRNHFAHRMDRSPDVLEGGELWDATETIKAISHMALVQQIGGSVPGLGSLMLRRSFVEYVQLEE